VLLTSDLVLAIISRLMKTNPVNELTRNTQKEVGEMKKWIRILGVVLIVGLLSGLSFSVVVFGQDMVDIWPQTLNLVEFGAEDITVHVSIDYKAEDWVEMKSDCSNITIQAVYTFADNRGELVAKFTLEDVASIVKEGENILTLYVNGGFEGSDTIQVIYGAMKNGK